MAWLRRIKEQTGNVKTFDDYIGNKLGKAAVERKLEIIGEALGKALKINPDLPISHKQNIIGMRNRIIMLTMKWMMQWYGK